MTELGHENINLERLQLYSCTVFTADMKFPRNKYPGATVVVAMDITVKNL
jgi:hypothetical protein